MSAARATVKAWLDAPSPSSAAAAAAASSGKDDVVLRFIFKWHLLLDSKNEQRPFVHFYISTNHSTDVHIIELETNTGQMPLALRFTGPKLHDTSLEDLLTSCELNARFFVRTVNNYNEAVQNPAGSVIVPLHSLFNTLVMGDGLMDKDVNLHMIHNPKRKNKGVVQFRVVTLQGGGRASPISLRGIAMANKHYNSGRIQRIIDRTLKNQNICARFIESTEMLYDNVRPTLKAVERINSAIWVSSAGVFPPIAYVVDVAKPPIPARFFENALQVVLKRNRLPELPRSWNITGDYCTAADVTAMENLCGQLLCLFEMHCVYRADFVYVFDTSTNEYIKVATEDFGDISVDRGAGDCEDFSKMIVRLYRALQRLSGDKEISSDLQRIIDFLACYYPFLTLLGVSSAQINAAPKDIVDMGAHENSILLPRLRFLRMAAQTCPEIERWMVKKLRDEPDTQEVKNWRQSLQYDSIVCEGTGMLHPTEKPEETIKIRKLMEGFMNENLFFALRREYFFSEKEGGFYKTVDKIFLACSILDAPSQAMPSFLVMQQKPGSSLSDLRKLPLNKLLTKSASFNAFLRAFSKEETHTSKMRGWGGPSNEHETVRLLMEPLLKPAEWMAIYQGMRNIHPPMPMDAPNYAHEAPFRVRCDRMMEGLFDHRKYDYTGSPEKATTMTYYLRASKVDDTTCGDLKDLFQQLYDDGLVLGWSIYPEWVTDEIGGYRIEMAINNARAAALENKLRAKKEAAADAAAVDAPANVARIRL